MTMRQAFARLVMGVALLAPLSGQAQQAPADRWTFSLLPYLWLPSIDGKLNYAPPAAGGGSPSVSVDADTLLDNLNFAFMITGEARRGRWLVATDVMYVDMGSENSTVRSVDLNVGPGRINVATAGLNAGTKSSMTAWVWTLGGGYAAVQGRTSLDVLAGFRYLSLETKTDWQLTTTVTGTGPLGNTATFAQSGSVKESEDVWAGIVGAKGRAMLGAQQLVRQLLRRRRGRLVALHLAGRGRNRVRLQVGRDPLRLPVSVLQPGRRQADRQPRARRFRAGRELPILSAARAVPPIREGRL